MNLAAVITETRDTPNINDIIESHLIKLPKYTKLYFYGSKQNNDRIKCDHVFIEKDIQSIEQYCYWITSEDFWNPIEQENVLIFQTDSGIIGGNIEDFYEYHYIGSPLRGEQPFIYNGGFSFRHKSIMLDIIKRWKYYLPNDMHEDGFFSYKVQDYYKKTPKEIAEKFAVENVFKLGTFGYHALERNFTTEEVNQIKNQVYEK